MTLRGSRRGRGYNSTSILPNRVVITNAKRLRLRRPPSLQLADILSTSRTKTLKEEKVNIIIDLLYK